MAIQCRPCNGGFWVVTGNVLKDCAYDMMKMLKRLMDKTDLFIMTIIVPGQEQAPSRNAISQIIALMIRKSDELAPMPYSTESRSSTAFQALTMTNVLSFIMTATYFSALK